MEGWHGDCDGWSSIFDGIERVKQLRDEILSRGQDAQGWGAVPNEAPPASQQSLVILNPFALKKMKHQNQEKVRQNLDNMRQQIKQTHSPIMLRRQEPQMILNPYVRSSP